MQEKALIFMDGGYLSKISKYFGKGKHLRFDLILFGKQLADRNGLSCEHIFYYTAPPFQGSPPTELEIKLKAGYDSFVSKIKQNERITIREGRLQKIGEKFTQKGVDTLLTMDLCREPLIRKTKSIILVAADTDFVPVLNQIRAEMGIRVILFYFTDHIRKSQFSMSNHLLTACDKKVLITEMDFIPKNNRKKEKRKGV